MKPEQLKLFKESVQPGDILFIAGRGWINDLIVAGQSTTDKTWTNQLGHVAFIDAEGKIQESAIDKYQGKMCSGILIRDLEEWNDYADVRWLIIMRIKGITQEQINIMTATGKRLQAKKLFYPIRELVGTLGMSINYNFLNMFKWINPKYIEKCQKEMLAKKNPLNTEKGFYFVAFQNHCSESAGLRTIPTTVNESQCKVGDSLRNNLEYDLIFIVPNIYKTYHKNKDQPFNLDISE